MSILHILQGKTIESLGELYQRSFTENDFQVNQTKSEFEGDYTIVLFSLVKSLKLSPDAIGEKLGDHLIKNNPQFFTGFNIIKGFLNLTVGNGYWLELLQKKGYSFSQL